MSSRTSTSFLDLRVAGLDDVTLGSMTADDFVNYFEVPVEDSTDTRELFPTEIDSLYEFLLKKASKFGDIKTDGCDSMPSAMAEWKQRQVVEANKCILTEVDTSDWTVISKALKARLQPPVKKKKKGKKRIVCGGASAAEVTSNDTRETGQYTGFVNCATEYGITPEGDIKPCYLVKWVGGFTPTWEPETNLRSAANWRACKKEWDDDMALQVA